MNAFLKVLERLKKDSKRTTEGLFWETVTINNGQVKFSTNLTIYNGVSGIVLFLLELFEKEDYPTYQYLLDDSVRFLKLRVLKEDFFNNGFYTGSLGVAYVIARYEQNFGEQDYSIPEILTEKVKPCQSNKAELLNGNAGEILAYMNLFEITRDEKILPKLEECLKWLISKVKFASKGVFWDYIPYSFEGVTGFAHGNSGIAFVLMEIANYFNNKSWLFLAQQAIIYEDTFFSKNLNNWIDTRRVGNRDSFIQKYLDGDVKFFETTGNTNAWCYGSVGIILTRIRAFELTGNKDYLDKVKKSILNIQKTISVKSISDRQFNLCHGNVGNAISLLKATKVLGNSENNIFKDLLEGVETAFIKNKFIQSGYNKNKFKVECPNLFTGYTGAAYFLLIEKLNKADALMNPIIIKEDFKNIPKSLGIIELPMLELVDLLLKNSFPNSMPSIRKIGLLSIPEHKDFKNYLKEFYLSNNVDFLGDESIFLEEIEAYQQKEERKAPFLMAVRSEVIREDIIKAVTEKRQLTAFYLNSDLWLSSKDSNYFLCYLPTFPQTRIEIIEEIDFHILKEFQNTNRYEIALVSIIEKFPNQEKIITNKIIDFFKKGILLDAKFQENDNTVNYHNLK